LLGSVAETLDSALKRELRAVLDRRPVTEAELRRLFEEGRACALILSGQLEKAEQRLGRLAADPAAPFTELAATLRQVNEIRPDLEELHGLLAALDEQARQLRASWASSRA
jgi:chromosome segregation ATPase